MSGVTYPGQLVQVDENPSGVVLHQLRQPQGHIGVPITSVRVATLACDPWTLIVTNPAGYSKIL